MCVVIYVQRGPLFTSADKKKYTYVYGQNVFTVERSLSFVTNQVRLFGF